LSEKFSIFTLFIKESNLKLTDFENQEKFNLTEAAPNWKILVFSIFKISKFIF
jgi:hypothetical protein